MLYFHSCPKCKKGTIEYGSDEQGKYIICLMLNKTFDIILLDLMLPGIDGLEICKRIRSENIDTPIIILTAKDNEIDKIVGLELGADDYVSKPFSMPELLARIKANLRRNLIKLEKNSLRENFEPGPRIVKK